MGPSPPDEINASTTIAIDPPPPGRRCASVRRFFAALSATVSSEPKSHWLLLVLAAAATLAALVASSLLSRAFYRYGDVGRSFWVPSWFATAGWPITAVLLLPLLVLAPSPNPLLSATLIPWCVLIGLLTAVANTLFVAICALPWGGEMLGGSEESPVSSFHGATTAAFAAVFGAWLARNRVGGWGLNAVVVVALAALAVAFEFCQRDENPAARFFAYVAVVDLPVSALRGLVLALTERVVRRRARGGSEASPPPLVTARVALQVQLLVSIFAFAFSCIGFFVKGGFGKVGTQARSYDGGKRSYYMVLAWIAVSFQVMAVGGAILVALCSTLFAGILGSARLPLTALVAIAFFPDAVTAYKVLGMVLAAWGFTCYVFGNLKY